MKKYFSILIALVALAGCAGGGGLDLEGTDTDPAVVEDPGWGDLDGEDGADLSPADEETAPVADTASGSLAIKGTVSSTLTQFQTFEKTIRAEGGSGSYDWSVVEGKLPDGITLQEKEGDKIKVKGVASKDGTFEGKIRVYDLEEEKFAEKSFDITVKDGEIIAKFPGSANTVTGVLNQCQTTLNIKSDLKSGEEMNSANAGEEKTYHFEAVGGKPPYIWQSVSSAFDINLIPSADSTKMDFVYKHSDTDGAVDELTVKVKDSCEGRDWTAVTYKFELVSPSLDSESAPSDSSAHKASELRTIKLRMKANYYCSSCDYSNWIQIGIFARDAAGQLHKVARTERFIPSYSKEGKWIERDQGLVLTSEAANYYLKDISWISFEIKDNLGKRIRLNIDWFEIRSFTHSMWLGDDLRFVGHRGNELETSGSGIDLDGENGWDLITE